MSDVEEQMLATRLSRRLRELLSSEGAGLAYLPEGVDVEIATVYAAAALRVVEEWLRWEAICKDRVVRASSDYCEEVARSVMHGDNGQGVVSFFNSELKKILVRIVRDFAPFTELPPWVIFYSTFRLRDPVTVHIARLGPGEQILRVPAFAALVAVLDSATRGLLEHYQESGAEIAAVTAEYIYWELMRPLSLFADVLERHLDAVSKAAELREELREAARSSGRTGPLGKQLARLYNIYAAAIVDIMKKRSLSKTGGK